MSSILEQYGSILSKLRTDKNKKRWAEQTRHKAPHKPFLLLSILDLISEGLINSNFIEPDFQLAETFTGYWSKIMPIGSSGSMSYPFYHLCRSAFWELQANPGYNHVPGRSIGSMKKLREIYRGAYIDEELFLLMSNAVSREALRSVLLETYFNESSRKKLLDQFYINTESAKYRDELLRFEAQDTCTAGWGIQQDERKSRSGIKVFERPL